MIRFVIEVNVSVAKSLFCSAPGGKRDKRCNVVAIFWM